MSAAQFSYLLPPQKLQTLAKAWLAEDCPSFDFAGYIAGEERITSILYLKSAATLAGVPFFNAVFAELECNVEWRETAREGEWYDVEDGAKLELASVTGVARKVLLGERVALNALAECCSVATAAREIVDTVRAAGWKGRVAGTRKTAPGLRVLQKYGMVVGGMDMHRVDLSGMVMLKDNHLAVAGGVEEALDKVRRVGGFSLKVDVECGSLEEAIRAAKAGADVVMLDNMGEETGRIAQQVKQAAPQVTVEASGGVTMDNISDITDGSVDVISLSINRHTKAIDLSLKVKS